MKAYRVSNAELEIDVVYLTERRAQSHVSYAKNMFNLNLALTEIDINKAARRRVLVTGDLLCYQFSRTVNGHRTVRRMVRNLRREGDVMYGEVEVLGRRIKVERTDCYHDLWRGVEFIGWTE